MTKAAELFQINTSPALGHELNARRVSRSADASKPGGRFGDMLSKASRSERKPSDDTAAASPADGTSADAKKTAEAKPAEKTKPKAAKAGKSDARKQSRKAAEESSEAADDASPADEAETGSTAVAESSADETGIDADSSNDEAAKAEAVSPETDATPSDLAALVTAPQARQVDQIQPAGDHACDAAVADVGVEAAAAAKPAAVNPATAASQPEATDADDSETDAAAAAQTEETPDVPPALTQHSRLHPFKPRTSGPEEESPEAPTSPAVATKNPAQAIAGSNTFDQLAEMLSNIASGHPAAAADDEKPVQAAPITAGYVPPVNGPREANHTGPLTPVNDAVPTPEARFTEDNHEKIVIGVRGELLPNGGTMKLRLDPPELGTMQVSLHMRDGVVSAAFETANGDAARLLSHTLSDLRSTLEAHGIVVDRLHVQQSSKPESDGGTSNQDSHSRGQTFEQQQDARREQQRKDMVQKLWDRLAGLAPIDLVA